MTVGKLLGRWGLPAVLAVLALIGWQAAEQADFESAEPIPADFEFTLETPMLSARRIPRTLRAPVSDEVMSRVIDEITAPAFGQPACISVRTDGRELAAPLSPQPTQALVPASNQKLLSTWAALQTLGADFTFSTNVLVSVAPVDGVVAGDLYLVGGGDPFLYTDDWLTQYDDVEGRHHTRLEDLADAVAAAGVNTINGAVVGDDSLFDAVRSGPWDQRLILQRQSGPLSALVVNEGFNDWPEKFEGTPRLRSPDPNPPLHAAAVFDQLLKERGVAIAAPPAFGRVPASGVDLAAVKSRPLSEIVSHINTWSSNLGAELVTKRLGLEVVSKPTTAGGAEAITSILVNAGMPMDGVVVNDGSGLAETNRVTCQVLAAVLAEEGPTSDFGRSLAVGAESGSLRTRFVDSPAAGLVLAKTGSLANVSSLSGYVMSAVPDSADHFVTFAQIYNLPNASNSDVVASVQEPLVHALVAHPAGPPIKQLSPADAVPTSSG